MTVVSTLLLCSCLGHWAFLPQSGVYEADGTLVAKYPIRVTGSGLVREVRHGRADCGGCTEPLEVLEANDAGIIEVATRTVLFPSDVRVGRRWLVAGRDGDRCVIERRVLAVASDRVQIEKVAVCDGVPLLQSARATWVIGRGCVREDFTGGDWRAVTYRGEEFLPDGGLP